MLKKGGELLDAFRQRYGFNLEVELQPSDNTLKILMKLHARRSADFISLAKVTNLLGARDLKADSETKTRLGKEITLVVEGAENKKKSDFNASPESFALAVRILMHGYALVSSKDQGVPWCSFEAARGHITKIEQLLRLDSRSNYGYTRRVRDADYLVRSEWAKTSQIQPELQLTQIIELISHRNNLWPSFSEFKPVRTYQENRVSNENSVYPTWKGKGRAHPIWIVLNFFVRGD